MAHDLNWDMTVPIEMAYPRYRLGFRGYTDGMKIAAIKAIREISGLGLKEAKDSVERGFPEFNTIYETDDPASICFRSDALKTAGVSFVVEVIPHKGSLTSILHSHEAVPLPKADVGVSVHVLLSCKKDEAIPKNLGVEVYRDRVKALGSLQHRWAYTNINRVDFDDSKRFALITTDLPNS